MDKSNYPVPYMILKAHPDRPGTKLRAIGYWNNKKLTEALGESGGFATIVHAFETAVKGGPFPDPNEWIDEDWDASELRMVVDYVRPPRYNYLLSGRRARGGKFSRARGGRLIEPLDGIPRVKFKWRGYSTCRICGLSPNGSTCIADDTFVWPEGFAHYIEEHSVRPPQEFIDHVKRKVSK